MYFAIHFKLPPNKLSPVYTILLNSTGYAETATATSNGISMKTIVLDNVTFSIPEPATLLLLGQIINFNIRSSLYGL